MDDVGSMIVDTVFTFGNTGFDWGALFNLFKSFSILDFVRKIMEIASPKNKLLFK